MTSILDRVRLMNSKTKTWRAYVPPASIIELCELGAQPEQPLTLANAKWDVAHHSETARWIYFKATPKLQEQLEILEAARDEVARQEPNKAHGFWR